ncbi:MAG: hypothetical protein ACXAB2_13635 [Candidatus Hodarchaeales archaeon]
MSKLYSIEKGNTLTKGLIKITHLNDKEDPSTVALLGVKSRKLLVILFFLLVFTDLIIFTWVITNVNFDIVFLISGTFFFLLIFSSVLMIIFYVIFGSKNILFYKNVAVQNNRIKMESKTTPIFSLQNRPNYKNPKSISTYVLHDHTNDVSYDLIFNNLGEDILLNCTIDGILYQIEYPYTRYTLPQSGYTTYLNAKWRSTREYNNHVRRFQNLIQELEFTSEDRIPLMTIHNDFAKGLGEYSIKTRLSLTADQNLTPYLQAIAVGVQDFVMFQMGVGKPEGGGSG